MNIISKTSPIPPSPIMEQQDSTEHIHTMQSIREAKSLRQIKQLKGFENTTSILGQVNDLENGLEGEEGDLEEERFIDEDDGGIGDVVIVVVIGDGGIGDVVIGCCCCCSALW